MSSRRKWIEAAAWSGWVGVWALAACGQNGGGGGGAQPIGAGPPVPVTELCHAIAEERCATLQCFGGGPAWLPCGLDACVADTDCKGRPDFEQALGQGSVTYDGVAFGACHAARLKAPCQNGAGPFVLQNVGSCPGAIKPAATEGMACRSEFECVPGLYCDKSLSCPGRCSPLKGPGMGCHGDGRACAEGLHCSVDRAVCEPRPKTGTPCTTQFDCLCTSCFERRPDDVAWCDPASKTCQPPRKAGQPCGQNGDASVGVCDRDLWCDSTTGVGQCRPFGSAGQPCRPHSCKKGFQCLGYLEATGALGTCSPPSAAGGPCTAVLFCGGDGCDSSYACAEGLGCDGDVCRTPGAAGATCAAPQGCAAGTACIGERCTPVVCPTDPCTDACTIGTCQGGVCAARLSAGVPCAANDDCASTVCKGGVCVDHSVCDTM